MNAELLKDLRDVISTGVKAGYANRKEIIDAAVDFLVGEADLNEIKAAAEDFTDSILRGHYITQLSWNYETDCDRLDEAFAELDRNGIVARQNFTCCQTCGHAEINYAIEETEEFHPVRGYVFFHAQDSLSAALNGYLYLAYGSVSGKEKESLVIAEEICDTLRRNGLEVDWNNSIRTRIKIDNINWQRRRLKEDE